MQIYPEKYDKLDLSASERSFLRTVERALADENMAYYILHINPRRIDVGGGKPELFNLFIAPDGIMLFRFIDVDNTLASAYISAFSNPIVHFMLEKDIREKLAQSKYLVYDNGNLKYDLKICYVFPNIVSTDVAGVLPQGDQSLASNFIFKDHIQDIRKEGKKKLLSHLSMTNEIKEDQVNYILQRLCPEITIPKKFTIEDQTVSNIHESLLTQMDRSVQSYRLDTWQIDIVNRINRGNQLILACAGSGKSVLLISKCFKLASLNPAENFLITCYNKNLYHYYEWAIGQAGFVNRNVKCATFFGLCRTLLENNHISLPYKLKGQDAQYYDMLFEKANEALANGQIKERFYGIFIDEVQIFRPEWYRFCFNLLKSKQDDEHYFVIAGDKSQDIKNNIKHQKAPWQGGGPGYPEYRGKTLPIERNYRNSKPINDAIDRYVQSAKRFGKKIGVDFESDPELFLRGTAYREGNKPEVISIDDYSNEGEAKAICDSIKKLISKGYSEVDIAVVMYNTRYRFAPKGWKTHYYNLISLIKERFYHEGWEDPAVLLSGENTGETYGSRRGVTIATIEGSLGLDFSAVILAGLLPLGVYEKVRQVSDFDSVTPEQLALKQDAYKKYVNLIYTGCTRAKDELTVVLSAPRGDSIYMDMIQDSFEEK